MSAAEDSAATLRRRLAEAEVDRGQLAELRAELERSEREVALIAPLADDVQHLRRRLEIARAEHARELGEREALHAARIADLEAQVERASRTLRDVHSSPSWRATRPLRALKRLLG